MIIPPKLPKINYAELKKRVVRPLLQKEVRKFGTKSFRNGTHPQMWRVERVTGVRKRVIGAGANLGPMGAKGDDRIVEIHINPITYSFLQSVNIRIDKRAIEKMISGTVMYPLKKLMIEKMKKIVPVDSGDLLTSMKKSISDFFFDSNLSSFPFLMVLNTKGVSYGKVVNNMPTDWLVHPGNHKMKLGKSGNILFDPNARHNFYGWIMKYGRDNVEDLWKQFLRDLAAILPRMRQYTKKRISNYNFAQSLFRIKYKNK